MHHTDWLLTTSERANAQTRLDDRHPGDDGLVRGQPGPAADPRQRPTSPSSTSDSRRPSPATSCSSPTGRATPTSSCTGEPGQRGRRGAGPGRRARCRRTRADLALAHGEAQLQRRGEPAARPAAPGARRRGAARHARAHGWLAPPEAGGHPAPRPSRARHRLRRRHRPVPLPPRRRRAPRRPAGTRDGAGVRRHPAVARRDGRDHRPRGVRRRDRLPGAVGGPDPADPAPASTGRRTSSCGWTCRRTRCPSRRRPRPRPRARRTRSSCCGPIPTCAAAATTRSRAAASAASRAATARR